MPLSEWKETTLAEFSPFIYGKGLPERDRVQNGNIPVYGSNGIVGKHDKAYVNNSGIIIGRKGTIGSVHLCRGPFCPIDTSFYIEDEPQKRDLFYTYYLLKTLPLKNNNDSAVPGLNRDYAHNLIITVPDIPEQQAIAEILGSLDDKIELNRQMNKTLEDMAQAIFKSWFVDFDPVKAKAEGRTIEGLSQEILDLFPDSFEDSELGDIPKGWKYGSLKDVCFVKGGYAYKSSDFQSTGYPVIKIKNIKENKTIDINDVQYIDQNIAFKTKDFWLFDGDLLMAMTGATVGKFGLLVNAHKNPCLLNQRVAKFFPLKDYLKVWFVYSYLSKDEILNQIINTAHGSAQPNISADSIMATKIIVPNESVINRFNDTVDVLFEKLLQGMKESTSLSNLRDSLLPKLISGEIRVPEAQKLVEGAL